MSAVRPSALKSRMRLSAMPVEKAVLSTVNSFPRWVYPSAIREARVWLRDLLVPLNPS